MWPQAWAHQPKRQSGSHELPKTVFFRDVPVGILQEKLPLEGGFGPQVGLGRPPPPLSSTLCSLRAKCAQ